MIEAFISKYGDRTQAPTGVRFSKGGSNLYYLTVPAGERPYVFVETLTPERVSVVEQREAFAFEIRTFNTLNGYYPGSDLRVRIYRKGDPDLLAIATAHHGKVSNEGCWMERVEDGVLFRPHSGLGKPEGGDILVQVHGTEYRAVKTALPETGGVRVQTLITRTPATPLETNIEIAVVCHIGPLRSR